MVCVLNEWNQTIFLDIDCVDDTCLVDHNHAVCLSVTSSNHAELICELLSVKELSSACLIHVEVSKLSNHEQNSELGTVLHQNWEVSFLLDLDVSRSLELLLVRGWVSYLHNVQLLCTFSFFLLTETE